MQQLNQHVGLMQSVTLEPSPVQSNTTQHHDPLNGAVQAMLQDNTHSKAGSNQYVKTGGRHEIK